MHELRFEGIAFMSITDVPVTAKLVQKPCGRREGTESRRQARVSGQAREERAVGVEVELISRARLHGCSRT